MADGMQRRNNLVLGGALLLVLAMVGLAFASVPLYNLFCRVTGLGGTVRQVEDEAERVLDRTVTVRFNAKTDAALPWDFHPETREITVRLGESALAHYRARNRASLPSTGRAVYNVTPAKAGRYFHKVQCFCFERQRLDPRAEQRMPVYFYIDPAMADKATLDEVTTITLSYTFFNADDGAPEPPPGRAGLEAGGAPG